MQSRDFQVIHDWALFNLQGRGQVCLAAAKHKWEVAARLCALLGSLIGSPQWASYDNYVINFSKQLFCTHMAGMQIEITRQVYELLSFNGTKYFLNQHVAWALLWNIMKYFYFSTKFSSNFFFTHHNIEAGDKKNSWLSFMFVFSVIGCLPLMVLCESSLA